MKIEDLQKRNPLAIIVKGNPKYLDDPAIHPMAERFYKEIKDILVSRGYEVRFDPGFPHTCPDETAVLWIGHSRGIDRLRFAPDRIRTYALQTNDHSKTYQDPDQKGYDPDHYELSDVDRSFLEQL